MELSIQSKSSKSSNSLNLITWDSEYDPCSSDKDKVIFNFKQEKLFNQRKEEEK